MSLPPPTVSVQGRSRHAGLPARDTLVRWVRRALAPCGGEVVLRFVDAREGRRLNRRYRGRDYATNVLTFDYAPAPRIAADIVICVPVVRREARERRRTLRQHLAHLVIHGSLHARGYDHRRAAEARAMEALEVELLGGLRVPDPYVDLRS